MITSTGPRWPCSLGKNSLRLGPTHESRMQLTQARQHLAQPCQPAQCPIINHGAADRWSPPQDTAHCGKPCGGKMNQQNTKQTSSKHGVLSQNKQAKSERNMEAAQGRPHLIHNQQVAGSHFVPHEPKGKDKKSIRCTRHSDSQVIDHCLVEVVEVAEAIASCKVNSCLPLLCKSQPI